nr:(Na+)-NQR maturation NqrM [Candidatus Photodesmus blepharus]
MSTFFLTFFLFTIVIFGMAIGYILQKKVVKGSCGGLGSLGVDKICNCIEPCNSARKNGNEV